MASGLKKRLPEISQLLHVYKSDEDQGDHIFAWRKNLKRCRGHLAEDIAPSFVVADGNWGL
jgi:hypothetical protein